jgi:hypothetical protein
MQLLFHGFMKHTGSAHTALLFVSDQLIVELPQLVAGCLESC